MHRKLGSADFRGFAPLYHWYKIKNQRKMSFWTLMTNGDKKSYRGMYQFINFQAVFGHLAKVHKYKILSGELIWNFGIMGWKIESWILADPVTGLLCKLA